MNQTYTSLFFVTVAALLSPWMSIRLFKGILPAVVIEILLGMLMGPHFLRIATSTVYIDFLAAFGFSYLMFLSGIELDFDLLFQRSESGEKAPWLRGLLFLLVSFLISLAIAFLMARAGLIKNVIVTSLILSTVSLGIVTPALKERGMTFSPFGQEILLYALIADVLTLVFFTAYITFHTTGNAFSLLLVLVLLLFFVLIERVLRLAQRFRFFHVVENATSEIGLRGSFALILAFVAISQSLGTEVVVGAFLAGAVISLLSEKHSIVTKKLNSIGYGFLLPIFFVNIGMKFDIQSISGHFAFWVSMAILLIGMYLNKLIPAGMFMNQFPVKHRVAAGILLSSQLSLTIAASQIAQQLGILSASMANGFILLAILTALISPILFSNRMKDVVWPDSTRPEPPASITIDPDTLPEGWGVDQIEVRSHRFDGIALRSLRLPQDLLFISIIRNEERIIPRGHTELQQFDTIQVMGEPEMIGRVRRLFEKG